MAHYLAAVVFVVGGFVLAGMFYLASLFFALWGAGPSRADTLLQVGCIVGGCVLAAIVLWPALSDRGPELVLDEHFLRFHHPDLVADMVIERTQIAAIHASHTGGQGHAFDAGLRLSSFDGTNLEMAFTMPQRIPRQRLATQLNPLPFTTVRTGLNRNVRGLRLRVEDVDWARQVFGTMPQYRALTEEDRTSAGLRRRPGHHQAIGVAILAVVIAVKIARGWLF